MAQSAPVPPAGNAAPLDTPAAPVLDDRPADGNVQVQIVVRPTCIACNQRPIAGNGELRNLPAGCWRPVCSLWAVDHGAQHLCRGCQQEVPEVTNPAAADGGPTDMELEAEADVGGAVDAGVTEVGPGTEGPQETAAAPGNSGGSGGGETV